MPTSTPTKSAAATSRMNGRLKDMAGSKAKVKGKRFGFLDLPLETQKQVVGHVRRCDLCTLQRTSSHLLSLASAVIYRDLDLNITNSETGEVGSRNSHAAEALQTILASEYDYGQHIKTFRLGVVEDDGILGGHNPRQLYRDPLLLTRVMWDSKSDSSKFLNTVLLLIARKATILESFQWDAPIELSGAVYRSLQKIASLRHLEVRLDVTPPSKMIIRQGIHAGNHPPPLHPAHNIPNPPGHPAPPQWTNSIPLPNIYIGTSASHTGPSASKLNNAKRRKVGGTGGYNYWADGRAFSGFKTLTTLKLLGLSNLDCLQEVADCIKASSATLKALTLSLSTELARKARKQVAAVNPEPNDNSDTELEDDDDPAFSPITPAPAHANSSTNEADVRKEKLAQDGILAKVFDLQNVSAEGKRLESDLSLSGGQCLEDDDIQDTVRKVNALMKSLMDNPIASDTDVSLNEARLEHYRLIKQAAELYIEGHNRSNSIHEPIKEPSKPSASKKSATVPKPLNPLASGFKPSTPNSKSPSPFEIDLSALSSPTSHLDLGNSSGSTTGNIPMYPSGTNISMNGVPGHSFNGNIQSISTPPYPYMAAYTAGQHPGPVFSSATHDPSFVGSGGAYSWFNDPHLMSPNGPPPKHNLHGGIMSAQQAALLQLQSNSNSSLSTGAKKAKTQAAHHKKKQTPAKKNPIASSDDESEGTLKTPSSAQQTFVPAEPATEPGNDEIYVDMEHPDEVSADLGEDQEILVGTDAVEAGTPRKRAKVGAVVPANPNLLIPSPRQRGDLEIETMSADEAMRVYIRQTHGLQLEELSLAWVPLKASLVARALDLSVLRHITLLQVGQQDSFWTLLVRLQTRTAEIGLRSIHTDNVSKAFLKFLATFEGLEELFMHERKGEADTSAQSPVNITMIRRQALQKHAGTLKRLMIKNECNESWDADTKTLRFLALRGAVLSELAVSLHMKTYHVFIQLLAGFKSLYALHIIALRSTDRIPVLQQESLNFGIDSLTHCPNMKIRYIALIIYIVTYEANPEFRKHLKTVTERHKNAKGKGKAPALSVPPSLDDSSCEELDDHFGELTAREKKLTKFSDVRDVKIFSQRVRLGKL